MSIEKGSRWLEVETGRVIVMLNSPSEADATPWWHYEGETTPWHCFIEDFYLWNRFRRLT